MRKILGVVCILFTAFGAFAQPQERVAGPGGPAFPCPHPVNNLTINNGPTPTPVQTEFPAALTWSAISGSVFNQTAQDTHFGHTITFPGERQCCLMTKGQLTVTIKALNSGPANSSTAANDAVHVVIGGAVKYSKQPWLTTGVTAGTVLPVVFPLTAADLANGRISIYVQDDTAVTSVQLVVSGCCIRKP